MQLRKKKNLGSTPTRNAATEKISSMQQSSVFIYSRFYLICCCSFIDWFYRIVTHKFLLAYNKLFFLLRTHSKDLFHFLFFSLSSGLAACQRDHRAHSDTAGLDNERTHTQSHTVTVFSQRQAVTSSLPVCVFLFSPFPSTHQ